MPVPGPRDQVPRAVSAPTQSAATLARPTATAAGASMIDGTSGEAAGFPVFWLAWKASVRCKRTLVDVGFEPTPLRLTA